MLVFCFVLSFSAIGYTAPSEPVYPITQTELDKSMSLLQKLERDYTVLLMDSETSNKQLIEALNLIAELKTVIEEQRKLIQEQKQSLEKSRSEIEQTQKQLDKTLKVSETSQELLQKYVNEVRLKQNKLRIERDLALLGVIYLLVRK